MAEYEIGRSGGQCSGCGQALAGGQDFFSAVLERPGGLERQDWCAACWAGPPSGALCHFRTRLAAREPRRRTFVDDAVLLEFFGRLGEAPDDPVRRDFRFVLALILMRKRLLKYERTERDGDQEHWVLRLVRDGTQHRVLDPKLDEARVQLLTGELSVVLADSAAASDDSAAETVAEPRHA